MAGSITVTTSKVDGSGGIVKYSIAWVSDAAGAVDSNTFDAMVGTIISVEFTPDSGGTQPTDLYDVDCVDAEGVTVFDNGAGTSIGANLSNATSSHHVPFIGGQSVTYVRRWHPGGTFEPQVTNAGNAKGGTINIYMAPGVL